MATERAVLLVECCVCGIHVVAVPADETFPWATCDSCEEERPTSRELPRLQEAS